MSRLQTHSDQRQLLSRWEEDRIDPPDDPPLNTQNLSDLERMSAQLVSMRLKSGNDIEKDLLTDVIVEMDALIDYLNS